MTDSPPGPGFWKASDGKWYPPTWEYHVCLRTHTSQTQVLTMLQQDAKEMGQNGWEMVNYTVQGTPSDPKFVFIATAFFKRMHVQQ